MAGNKPQLRVWLWMIPVLLLATGLGSMWLSDDILWNDEVLSLAVARSGIFLDVSWPPLYFPLLAIWDKLVGGQIVLDRALSLFIGLLTIAITYQLGRKLFSEKIAVVAALLLASSAFFANYLHEIRAYSLYVMVCVLCAWMYWLVIDSRYNQSRWVRWGFAFSVALTLYTHYIATATILTIGLYHLLSERPDDLKNASDERSQWLLVLRLGVNGCLLYAPWSAVLISSLLTESDTVRNTSLVDLLRDMSFSFSNGLGWLVLPLLLISILFIRQPAIRFLWGWLGVTIIVAILGNLAADFLVHPRHVIGLLPPIVLIIAFTLYQLNQHLPPVMGICVGIWVGVGIIYSTVPNNFMDTLPAHVQVPPTSFMNTVFDAVETCIAEDDAVFFALDTLHEEWINDLPLIYYLDDFDFRKLVMSYALHDVRAPSLLLSGDLDYLNDAQPIDRFNYMVEDASMVWVFAVTNRPLHHDILRLDSMLNDAGYQVCSETIQAEDTMGIGYSRSANSQCARSVPCVGQ